MTPNRSFKRTVKSIAFSCPRCARRRLIQTCGVPSKSVSNANSPSCFLHCLCSPTTLLVCKRKLDSESFCLLYLLVLASQRWQQSGSFLRQAKLAGWDPIQFLLSMSMAKMLPNPALNLAPLSRCTLGDKASQGRLDLRLPY